MKNTDTLERLCEIVDKRLETAVDALERESGKLSMEDAKYIDLLTHTQKSIKTTLAMEGAGKSERRGRDSMGRYVSRDGEDGHSGWYYGPRRAWDGGPSYDGESYDDGMKEKLRRMAEETDDERVKRALHTAIKSM